MDNSLELLLRSLQRQQQWMHTDNKERTAKRKEVRLMIGVDVLTQQATLSVVDKKLQKVAVDANDYDGALGSILRSMERIGMEQSFGSWDSEEENKVQIGEHPELVYMLMKCEDLLVNKEGESVKFHDEVKRVVLRILDLPIDEKKEPTCLPALYIQDEEDKHNVEVVLSDSFVMCDNNVIYPVQSLGEGGMQLLAFRGNTFGRDSLEDFLSIFYSYAKNVDLATDDRLRVIDKGEQIECIPTLCFEKVDADKALYLRVMNSMPGNDNELINKLNLGVKAVIGIDKQVELKHIARKPLEESIDTLSKILTTHAPNRQAKKDIYQEGDFFIVPEESAGPFLFNALPQLLKHFALIGADKLREYKVSPAQPKLNVQLSSGIDFLEGDASIEIGDDVMTIQDVLSAWRKQRYVVLSDGNRAIIADDYMKRLERIFDTKKKGKGVKISFFDLPEVEDMLQERLEGEVMQRHRKVYEGFNDLKNQKLKKPKVNATLRDYQQEGIKWIKYLYDNNLGGCLADDMGLGKTIQTIAVLTDIYPKTKKPTLIIMPRSLVFNWKSEIDKFAPQLNTYIYYGTERNLDEAMKAQAILTTYAVVRNDIESLKDKKFVYVILDESQNIKNVAAQATQAIHLLQAEHRLALSGTPVENNLTELYSLFRFLNPAMFGSLDTFNQRYTYPIQRDGDKAVLGQLRRKIFPFLLRRLKKDVLTELPDRIDQTLRVEMNDGQKKLYEERRKYYHSLVKQNIKAEGVQKSQFVMFQALNELRQIASIPENYSDGKIVSPKTEMLIDSLTEAVENGHKVVVFFNFLTGIEIVAEKLTELGIGYEQMTGATTNRGKVVDRFQNSPDCQVMLMTLKTGGVGLNLTAADTVFIFEPWWNKAAEEQAINRLHRMGQKQKVLSYSIIAEGTIEEKILLLQQQKAELFEGLIGSDSSSTKMLTEEDINFILG